ncbi:MAG: ribosome maturation factor RimP [Candidatus Eremiobacteraeota bacterium]|nr:ribosome maturation factor RimP [Candidatus Eremiobacteraeota bacterium]MBV8365616.1 ribosome maturation factor RimP [Candidatus Eremiobacteraeota bacterium]
MIERFESVLAGARAEFADIEVLVSGVRRERGSYVLWMRIDRPGGVDTALCERVARAIDRRAEALGDAAGPYTIEVASAGVDRPLLEPAHYRRFAGREARIITRLRIANRVEFSGAIEDADDARVRIADRYAGSVDIPYAAIKRANLVYHADDDLKRARPARAKERKR